MKYKFSGEKMAEIRESKNKSKGWLARKIEGSVPAISRYERGLRTPRMATFLELIDALDCNPEDLIVRVRRGRPPKA